MPKTRPQGAASSHCALSSGSAGSAQRVVNRPSGGEPALAINMAANESFPVAGCEVWFPAGVTPFPAQRAVISKAIGALSAQSNALLESPTGTGKTLALLSSVLAYTHKLRLEGALAWLAAAQTGGGAAAGPPLARRPPPPPRVFFASRTHSQLSQVVRELRRLEPLYLSVTGDAQQRVLRALVDAMLAAAAPGDDDAASAAIAVDERRREKRAAGGGRSRAAARDAGGCDDGGGGGGGGCDDDGGCDDGRRPSAAAAAAAAPARSAHDTDSETSRTRAAVRGLIAGVRAAATREEAEALVLAAGVVAPLRSVLLASRTHLCVHEGVQQTKLVQAASQGDARTRGAGVGSGRLRGSAGGWMGGAPSSWRGGGSSSTARRRGGNDGAAARDIDPDDDERLHGVRVGGAGAGGSSVPPPPQGAMSADDPSLAFSSCDGQLLAQGGAALRRVRLGLGHGSVDADCKSLLEEAACRHQHETPALVASLPQVWDIEDIVHLSRGHPAGGVPAGAAAGGSTRSRGKRAFGVRAGGCPYFASREAFVSGGAQLVLVPYTYLIDPVLREAMGVDLHGAIVVFDEAHNIEDTAREAASHEFAREDLLEAAATFRDLASAGNLVRECPACLPACLLVCVLFLAWSMRPPVDVGGGGGAPAPPAFSPPPPPPHHARAPSHALLSQPSTPPWRSSCSSCSAGSTRLPGSFTSLHHPRRRPRGTPPPVPMLLPARQTCRCAHRLSHAPAALTAPVATSGPAWRRCTCWRRAA